MTYNDFYKNTEGDYEEEEEGGDEGWEENNFRNLKLFKKKKIYLIN